MNTAIAAERKIEAIAEKCGLTPQGKNWLDLALDPFKDVPSEIGGYPDMTQGQSCIQTIKSTQTFTSSVDEDMLFFFDNVDVSVGMSTVTRVNNGLFATAGAAGAPNSGGLNIRRGATGVSLNHSTTFGQVALGAASFNGGRTRVLAKAFEVHNVTPELVKGGSVTVFRNGQGDMISNPPESLFVLNDLVANNPPTCMSAHEQEFVPETIGAANLIPGSKSWDAKDGCYVVAIQTSDENLGQEYVNNSLTKRPYHLFSGGIDYVTTPGVRATSNVVFFTQNAIKSPHHISGAYFTGLPVGTKLRVDVIYILERFPDDITSDLFTMATPTCPYDPAALELYSRTAHRLPPGTMAKNNGLGDWIKLVADTLATFGVPGMGLLSAGINAWNLGRKQMKEDKMKKNNTYTEKGKNDLVSKKPKPKKKKIVKEIIVRTQPNQGSKGFRRNAFPRGTVLGDNYSGPQPRKGNYIVGKNGNTEIVSYVKPETGRRVQRR